MGKEIKIVAAYKGQLKSILWISLQDDGSISIGMSDRTLLIPGIISETEYEGEIHQSCVDFEKKYGIEVIRNPHFTFHPPMYVHLRVNKKQELFAGLLGVDFIVENQGRLPWIRFISNPFRELKPFDPIKQQKNLEVVRFIVPSDEASVGIAFDFVRQDIHSEGDIQPNGFFINWYGRTLQVSRSWFPAQKSTVQWYHES